ncbi:DUF2332 domain-containing protein [Solicola sp. PLA-1-18]|uniref:DUF2332 domain-containing protein n=1 Tax=Solicola sp. PLA-1-18 TaxID=3380532 RepID=UPI003B82AA39
MNPSRTVDHVRDQAAACGRRGSAMYEDLLTRLADDLDAGGPTADVLRGHEADPGPSALALRLVGGLHRLVLDGTVPALAASYPTVGGRWDGDAAWPVVLGALVEHRETLRAVLDSAPQTNDPGRSAALLGGLMHVLDAHPLPVRLWELGCSAGLNLRFDAWDYRFDGGTWGVPDSPVRLDDCWRGPTPPVRETVDVVERVGVDLAPIDVTTADGRLRLLSYVWPDQADRVARLRGALEVAAEMPVDLLVASAGDALDELDVEAGVVTVVWHSFVRQYLDRAEQDRVSARLAEIGGHATAEAPFAHLQVEPVRRDDAFENLVRLTTWPGGSSRVLGGSAAHGVPTTWE